MCAHVYVYVCMCARVYVYVCMCLYVVLHVCMYGFVRVWICVWRGRVMCSALFLGFWFGAGVETCGALCCRLGRRRGRLIGYDVSRKLS